MSGNHEGKYPVVCAIEEFLGVTFRRPGPPEEHLLLARRADLVLSVPEQNNSQHGRALD